MRAARTAIVVAPGANDELRPEDVDLPDCDGVLCQLEIPLETVEHVANTAPGDFFLNAAPARGPVPAADVTIVNRYELEALTHREGVIAVTLGAEGAILLEDGRGGRARDAASRRRPSTGLRPATRSRPASSSRSSRAARATRRSAAPASRARSPRRGSARRRRSRPPMRWTRSCEHPDRHRLRPRP